MFNRTDDATQVQASDWDHLKTAERQAWEAHELTKRRAARQAEAEKAFRESPVGQATTAYERGDGFFQIQLEVSEVTRSFWSNSYQGYSVKEGGSRSHADLLSTIEAVGWRLEHVGYVYVMTGQVSRDKFLSSGQEVGVMGKTQGIYLFRRAETPGGVARVHVDESTDVVAEETGASVPVSATEPPETRTQSAYSDYTEPGSDHSEQTVLELLLTHPGPYPTAVAKALRDISHMNLREAQELIDEAPSVLLEDLSKQDAEWAIAHLESAGASVEPRVQR